MATTGNVTASGTMTNAPSGQRTYTVSRTFAAAVDFTTSVALVNGSVTVNVPSGATYCRIFPPNATNPVPNPTYSGTITLKGVAGDTGVAISNSYSTELQWDSSNVPASFVLTATVAGTAECWFA